MAASSSPSPHHERLSFERRPKLLKDFLQDDPYSCSSNDFRSYPQKLCKSTSSNFHGSSRIVSKRGNSSHDLLRSKSCRAASATISAINKVINIVKFLPFASVKSSSILPRSISRKLSRKHSSTNTNVDQDVSVITVKVKDILRWKSFKDLVDEKSIPLDSSYSPCRCTTTTANYSTATSSTTNTSSKRSSWCDSDFTAEDLPSWFGKNGELLDNNGMRKVGRKNILEDGVGGCKEALCFDENEQHSPVSVLESPFQEDICEEGSMAFSFHRSLSNLDKKKSMLMRRIQQFTSLVEENTSFKEEEEVKEDEETQEIEEKAKQMLSHLKETNSLHFKEHYEANYVNHDALLFDFFYYEMSTANLHNNGESKKLIREAKSWISGEYNGDFEWEIEDKRGSYIKDMERVGKWNKFEEEKQELIMDLEFQVLNDLIHEVLEDVFLS